MDQNIATVVVASIVSISTLSGTYLNEFLTSHRSLKLDKDKAKDEQQKQRKQLIEEVYGQIIDGDNKLREIIRNARRGVGTSSYANSKIREIKDDYGKIRIPVNLYVPGCKDDLDWFVSSANCILETLEDIYDDDREGDYGHVLGQDETNYIKGFEKLQRSLELLVDDRHKIQNNVKTQQVELIPFSDEDEIIE